MRIGCAAAALLLAVCLLAGCVGGTAPAVSGESSAAGPSASEETNAESGSQAPEEAEAAESASESSEAASLPPPEAIVLLYTDYLTVRAEQDGLVYEYTYCFDEAHYVFNAIAVIRFPTEEEAGREYERLLKSGYPNLELDGSSLSFCFPRKECPFYGISYRALEVLLAETVYEIIESHPPAEPEESAEG